MMAAVPLPLQLLVLPPWKAEQSALSPSSAVVAVAAVVRFVLGQLGEDDADGREGSWPDVWREYGYGHGSGRGQSCGVRVVGRGIAASELTGL